MANALYFATEKGMWKVPLDFPPDLYRKLYLASFVEIVNWWFKNGCKETPEQIEAWFKEFCTGEP